LAACDAARLSTGWTKRGDRVLEALTSARDGHTHPAIVANGYAYCGFDVIVD
jgi:hypothetical protein